MHARIAAFVVAALSVTACTLLIDAEGFTGGDTTDGASDVATSDGQSGGSDAASDSPTLGNDASDVATGGPYVACPSYAQHCDDFETGNLSKWTGTGQKAGGTVSIVTDPVFKGLKAMRAHRPIPPTLDGAAPATEANVYYRPAQHWTSGMIVVRAHMRMPDTLVADTTLIKIKAASASDDANLKVNASGFLKIDTDTPNAGSDKLSTAKPALNAWFCVEWQMTLGAQGHQTLFVNGQKVIDANENISVSVGWDEVGVGFADVSQPSDDELFYDDVAIATQPLPCP